MVVVALIFCSLYSYGCAIWERDFEVIDSNSLWSEQLSASIREALITHEKRLQNIKATTTIGEEEFITGKGENIIHRVKRKISVKIMGNFIQTNQEFTMTEVLYISPLSVEEAQ